MFRAIHVIGFPQVQTYMYIYIYNYIYTNAGIAYRGLGQLKEYVFGNTSVVGND